MHGGVLIILHNPTWAYWSLVGGGMYVHNIDALHHALHFLPAIAGELLTGMVLGTILVGGMHLVKRLRSASVDRTA